MKKIVVVLFCISLLSSDCGVAIPLINNKGKLSNLELLQSKNQVRTAIGEPDEVRGSLKNVDGDIVTVWQYNLYSESDGMKNFGMGFFTCTMPWFVPDWKWTGLNSYWIYFVNDTMVQWGRAGDWQPDQIMKIRLNIENNTHP